MKSVRARSIGPRGRFGLRRSALVLTAAAAALVVAVPTTAGAAINPSAGVSVSAAAKYKKNGSFKVKSQDFGIHAYQTDPDIPAGTIRIAGAPSWLQVQPNKGTWDWSMMNVSLDRAKAWGISDVLISIFGTPAWAGSNVSDPASEIQGPRSTSAPVKMSDWKTYITELVKKYGSRISAYQVWNEATSPQFYQGTPKKLASMTKAAKKIIDKYDPSAVVVASSVQTHRQNWFDAFAPSFFKQLKKKKWPVDVLAGHFYPALDGGPKERVAQIQMFHRAADKAGAPNRLQRWDTETNFDLGSHASTGKNLDGRIRGNKAAWYVGQTYLDSWRLGLRKTYWYLWTQSYNDFPGIQMYQASQPGPTAYRTLAGWTVGQKFSGCKTSGKVVNCQFKKSGKTSNVLYTTGGKATYKFSGRKQVCKVNGAACSSERKSIKVKKMPVRVS